MFIGSSGVLWTTNSDVGLTSGWCHWRLLVIRPHHFSDLSTKEKKNSFLAHKRRIWKLIISFIFSFHRLTGEWRIALVGFIRSSLPLNLLTRTRTTSIIFLLSLRSCLYQAQQSHQPQQLSTRTTTRSLPTCHFATIPWITWICRYVRTVHDAQRAKYTLCFCPCVCVCVFSVIISVLPSPLTLRFLFRYQWYDSFPLLPPISPTRRPCFWPMVPSWRVIPSELIWPIPREKWSSPLGWWDIPRPWPIRPTRDRSWSWRTHSLEITASPMNPIWMIWDCRDSWNLIRFISPDWSYPRTRGNTRIGRPNGVSPIGWNSTRYRPFTVSIPVPSRKSCEKSVPCWDVSEW